nr:zinc finger, CCHC-type, retrotransposon Gag domain protein [Tanacetum cinerariifolium]
MFTTEYAPVEELDKIQEEFQTLTQTNETVNEMWKKFNNLIRYCPKYHENEKIKDNKFQRMLRNKSIECSKPKAIEAKPLKSIKEENVEKMRIPTPTARAYMMATEGDKVVRDVVTEVELASDEIIVVSKVYQDVEIEIDDSVFKIDLIPIVLGAFDIVIGMDWLV